MLDLYEAETYQVLTEADRILEEHFESCLVSL
jgi:hypothetical protein